MHEKIYMIETDQDSDRKQRCKGEDETDTKKNKKGNARNKGYNLISKPNSDTN
jgi:hypothetical protein